MVAQLRQIELIEPLAEFLFQVRGVLGPNAERDDRPGVAQHCVPDVGLKLVHVLMGHGEADPVLTQF